ncbi:PREDICTED: N-formyl peptide receptor 2 [Elephantulus edwardii]|uniref:N-formyl peptide receptor 2 n=1 Tax=Elephantulus edwardii TaxID=28737 RepID=UPI0003F07598|nr:PREDICTED: N-formyl peptide receptor 2 [Elephantulus edwardii]
MENNSSQHEESESAVYTVVHVLSLVLLGITFVLGLLGNGLVIWVAGFRMPRTVTTVCYLNLAIADVSFVTILPFVIASQVMKGEWPFGGFLCKLITGVADTNLCGSLFLITLISLDRCLCVRHPVWTQNHRTVGLARRVISGLWILALVLTLPMFILSTTLYSEEKKQYCVVKYIYESWGNTTEERLRVSLFLSTSHGIIRFLVAFSFPVFTITICYGLLVTSLLKKGLVRPTHPLRVLTAVIISFFLCCFPFQLITLLNTPWIREELFRNREKLSDALFLGTRSLAFFNSCLNPMLYAFVGQDFQKRLLHSLPANLERALHEDLDNTGDTSANSTSSPSDRELKAT